MPDDNDLNQSYPLTPSNDRAPQLPSPDTPARLEPTQTSAPAISSEPTQMPELASSPPEQTLAPSSSDDPNNEGGTHIVDTILGAVDAVRRIRIIISIISLVVVIIALGVTLLHFRSDSERWVEEAKQEQAAAEEKEERRKVTLTATNKTFDVYPTFGKTVKSALENDVSVYYYAGLGVDVPEKTITKKNVDRILSVTLGKFSGASYGIATLNLGFDDYNSITISSPASLDKDTKLNDLYIHNAETSLLHRDSLKINGKEFKIGTTSYDEFLDIFGQPSCEIENYDSFGGKAKKETNYSAQVHDIGNDIILVSIYRKDKGNVLSDVEIDFLGISKRYCQ